MGSAAWSHDLIMSAMSLLASCSFRCQRAQSSQRSLGRPHTSVYAIDLHESERSEAIHRQALRRSRDKPLARFRVCKERQVPCIGWGDPCLTSIRRV